jgi:hypothetical protein
MESLCLLLYALSSPAQLSGPQLNILARDPATSWISLSSSFQSNTVVSLQTSTNLRDWQSRALSHDALYAYPDLGSDRLNGRFYRLAAEQRGVEDDWKNQLLYLKESFRSTNDPLAVTWVKFAILLKDPTRVYYQDSRKYPLHYDFAIKRLAPFKGVDYATFEALALHRTNQVVVLGSVLYPPMGWSPPGTVFTEYGVQFDGLDPYTPDEIARWFELVRVTIYATNGLDAFYMPTLEQNDAARTNTDAYEQRGIPLSSVDRWVSLNSCYSAGWALGRLKYFAATEITAAFGDGRLRPEDILLTDGVPADTPVLAGIISLTACTPNSHTAILAQSFGIPFVYLPDAAAQVAVQQLVGHKILLRATSNSGVTAVKIVDLEGRLDPLFEAELLELKAPEPIQFLPKQTYGAISASTDTLVPTDIQYFGGKAANFGFLRRGVPTNSPVAIAFSFDLWEAFLDQTLPGGATLRAEIARRLGRYTNYPPDIISLKTDLAAVRALFTDSASFTTWQKQAITNALGIFNPRRNIRFRSSTNVEDSEHFTGAGLYDSYSGCLADDADGDTTGPCQCDPTEPKERGVFRALQKVYASFYNDDAFLERLSHRVDETKVAMGVLVHHSFPDDEELANGVATPLFKYTPAATNLSGTMVTQLGAVSVTNPDGTSVPEIVSASDFYQSGYHTLSLSLKQYSSLVPLGSYVMGWQADYRKFIELFQAIGLGFHQFYPAKTNFYLDFEYKKDANLGLLVKQVREMLQPDVVTQTTPFLIDEPTTWRVIQMAGGGQVFGTHRLKSLLSLHTASLRLYPTNVLKGIYTQGSLEYHENGALQTLGGPIVSWASESTSSSSSTLRWSTGTGASSRAWRLDTTITTNVTGSQPPVLTQQDFHPNLSARYATPMPKINGQGPSTTATNEMVRLEPVPAFDTPGPLQVRTLQTNGITLQTSYYWPKTSGGLVPFSSPLLRFAETHITGLTTNPIVLTNYYSQSYGAFNHNYYEEFIFDPRLDPGSSPALLAELQAANIQLIYAWINGGTNRVLYVLGYDGVFRRM